MPGSENLYFEELLYEEMKTSEREGSKLDFGANRVLKRVNPLPGKKNLYFEELLYEEMDTSKGEVRNCILEQKGSSKG